VARCFDLAVDWRQEYGTDVVIDIVCYRRFGHNETDQPHFTQPAMYDAIDKHPGTITLYREQLAAEGVVDEAWIDGEVAAFDAAVDEAFERVASDFICRCLHPPPALHEQTCCWLVSSAVWPQSCVSQVAVLTTSAIHRWVVYGNACKVDGGDGARRVERDWFVRSAVGGRG
jgi:hypothetical protein